MSTVKHNISDIDAATIRFAGDSGDGMQLTGNQFSDNTAIFGNDLSTLPDSLLKLEHPKVVLQGLVLFSFNLVIKTYILLAMIWMYSLP